MAWGGRQTYVSGMAGFRREWLLVAPWGAKCPLKPESHFEGWLAATIGKARWLNGLRLRIGILRRVARLLTKQLREGCAFGTLVCWSLTVHRSGGGFTMLPRILGARPEGVAVSPSQLVWTHALCLTVMVVVGCGGDGTTDPLDQPPNPTIVDVVITPRSRELITGDTASFVAVGRRSDGTTKGVTATFTADGGTVSSSGSYVAGQQAGSFHVVAALVVDGKALADTASILLTEPVASNTVANPSALPTASGQLKNVTAYTALNVRGMAAGGSYTDPVTGVRVWKMTSTSGTGSRTVGVPLFTRKGRPRRARSGPRGSTPSTS